MKRLFAAIKISPDDNFLRVYYQLLRQFEGERIKWVEPHNLHITLKFFGETEESRIKDIKTVMQSLTNDYCQFMFQIKGIGVFGSSYKPKLIWFGVDNNDQLKIIGNDLINRLNAAGFVSDRQNFVPHLTIGRIRELKHKRSFQSKIDTFKEVLIQRIEVSSLFLFESELTKTGPVYKVIDHFALQ